MGNYLHPAHVANVVTSFCLLWSGVILTLFWFLESNQPLRWLFFYFTIIITAIPTIIHHIIPENLSWTSLDIMSNVLLVVALELALVGDYFTQKVRMFFLWLFGILNLLAIAYLFSILVFPIPNIYIPLGSSKGFSLGEIVLILNAIVSVVILAVNFGKLRKKEKVVFLVVVGMFLLGLVFATGSDGYIFPKHIAWHSMWHIVGSFGFVLFWYFNHLRFSNKE